MKVFKEKLLLFILEKDLVKIFQKSILVGFICSVLMSFAGLSQRCENISDKIIRLHIIANSDLKNDQELKLKIRDKILQSTSEYFKINEDIDETVEILKNNLEKFEDIAQREIANYGYDYPVKADIKRMYFHPRVYGKVTLPGGNYRALRITLGEGKGKNWWCVVFPPMCLPAAEEPQELENVLNQDEMEIVENEEKYEVRFKFLDIFNKIKDWFVNLFKSDD